MNVEITPTIKLLINQWETYLKLSLNTANSKDEVVHTCINDYALGIFEQDIKTIPYLNLKKLVLSNKVETLIETKNNEKDLQSIKNTDDVWLTIFTVVKSTINLSHSNTIDYYRLFYVLFNPSYLPPKYKGYKFNCYLVKYDIDFDRYKTVIGEISFSDDTLVL